MDLCVPLASRWVCGSVGFMFNYKSRCPRSSQKRKRGVGKRGAKVRKREEKEFCHAAAAPFMGSQATRTALSQPYSPSATRHRRHQLAQFLQRVLLHPPTTPSPFHPPDPFIPCITIPPLAAHKPRRAQIAFAFELCALISRYEIFISHICSSQFSCLVFHLPAEIKNKKNK